MIQAVSIEGDAAIIEHNSTNLPVIFGDAGDSLRAWVDFHEPFDVSYTDEEMAMLEVLEIPNCRETGIAIELEE